jgi:hypothetical protein
MKEPAEMAEELNKCFSEVFTRENQQNIPRPRQHATRSNLTSTFITSQKVRKQIKKLKPTGAAGPDGITTPFLQKCADVLSQVLACIYRKSINAGAVPAEWKLANVVPIYKKGSKALAGNYRPISLTCICCKIMESILKADIMAHLHRNGIITKSQHGFTRGRSCATYLLEFMEPVTAVAEEVKSVDIVYIRQAVGIRGNMQKWISDWLTERKQCVVVGGKFSGWIWTMRQ